MFSGGYRKGALGTNGSTSITLIEALKDPVKGL